MADPVPRSRQFHFGLTLKSLENSMSGQDLWNLTARTEGRRRGPSPYAQLGIDFVDDGRPWYEVLLQKMNAN